MVDLPLSTWPTTTKFMCGFLLALISGKHSQGLYLYFDKTVIILIVIA
jgi:hypothetical protein